ncbi:hypothetical protein FG475_03345 [Vibrio navarrensis]|nr:hypothetical protein [Vibrio navarrensis]EJL6566651.1 hypothetical protein [Vibrio navarrensis]
MSRIITSIFLLLSTNCYSESYNPNVSIEVKDFIEKEVAPIERESVTVNMDTDRLGDKVIISYTDKVKNIHTAEIYSEESNGKLGEPITLSNGNDIKPDLVAMNDDGDRVFISDVENGQVNIYDFINGVWIQTDVILMGVNSPAITSLDINSTGTSLVVGSVTSQNATLYNYDQIADTWISINTFYSDSPNQDASFGSSVAITASSDRVIVGDPKYDSYGAFFEFNQSNGNWSVNKVLGSNYWYNGTSLLPGSKFAESVSISDSGDRIIVGAPGYSDYYNHPQGIAALFNKEANGDWILQSFIKGSEYTAKNYCGINVDISSNTNNYRAITSCSYSHLFPSDIEILIHNSSYETLDPGALSLYSVREALLPEKPESLYYNDMYYSHFGDSTVISKDGNMLFSVDYSDESMEDNAPTRLLLTRIKIIDIDGEY